MAKAISNLVAASLETLQVVNLRLQASHAVEDAAVIYLKQMEEKQEADRRAMWLQTVHTETLETILDEWRFKAGLLRQPEQNTTGNTLRTDPDCPGRTSANHKGDHPIVPAPGEMFIMTPTCALSWCEKDAVWDNGQDEYALCCTEEHRIQVEQEAVRWMSQYRIKLAPSITDDRRNVSAEDAACPGQAASNHKGDHPCDKSSERRIGLKGKVNAKYRLAQLIITNMRKKKDEVRMWRATMKHFILFIDRCFTSQMLQLWCNESEPMPELESASGSSSVVTSPSYSPASTDSDSSTEKAQPMPRTDNDPPARPLIDMTMLAAALKTRAINTTIVEKDISEAYMETEDSDGDEMPPLHRLEIL